MELEQASREYEMLLSEEKRVTGLLREAEREYALALGESIGVKLGSVVTTKQKEGYGSKVRQVKRRYRVTRIALKSYGDPPLSLTGVTIRKDGTDGETHEIWLNWNLEKTK